MVVRGSVYKKMFKVKFQACMLASQLQDRAMATISWALVHISWAAFTHNILIL